MDSVTKSFLHAVDVQHNAVSSPFKPLELLSMLAALIWLRLNSSKGADSSGFSAGEQFAAYQSEPLAEQADSMALSGDITGVSPVDISLTQAPGLEQALHRLSTLPEPYRDVIESFVDSLPLDAESEHAEALAVLDTIIGHYQKRYPRDIQTTPQLVADLMVALVEPKPIGYDIECTLGQIHKKNFDGIMEWLVDSSGDFSNSVQLFEDSWHEEIIYDPCCGLGGLLIACEIAARGKGVLSGEEECIRPFFHGTDINPDALLVAFVRLSLANVENKALKICDSLNQCRMNEQEVIQADIVLATPPWGENTRDNGVSEALFVQHAVDSLKPGGRGVIAVPDDFLSQNIFLGNRKDFVEKCIVRGVISLPIGAYLPWSNRKISLIFFTKKDVSEEADVNMPVRIMILPESQSQWTTEFTLRDEQYSFISETILRFKEGKADRFLWERPMESVRKFNMDLAPVRNPVDLLSDLLTTIRRLSDNVEIVPLGTIATVFCGMICSESLKVVSDDVKQQIGLLRSSDINIREGLYVADKPHQSIPYEGIDGIHVDFYIQNLDIVFFIENNSLQLVSMQSVLEDDNYEKIIPDDNFIVVRLNNKIDYDVTKKLLKSDEYQNLVNYFLNYGFKGSKLCDEIKNLSVLKFNKYSKDILDAILNKDIQNLDSIDNFLFKEYIGNVDSPVVFWLEKSDDVKKILSYNKNINIHDNLELIEKFSRGYLEAYLLKPIYGYKDKIYKEVYSWISKMRNIMQNLTAISTVPNGPVRYLLLDNAVLHLSKVKQKMSANLTKCVDPYYILFFEKASHLMESLVEVIKTEKIKMIEDIDFVCAISPDYVFIEKENIIILTISNNSIMPYREVIIETEPDYGQATIPYFAEGGQFTCKLSIPPRTKPGAEVVNVKWKRRRLSGFQTSGNTYFSVIFREFEHHHAAIDRIIDNALSAKVNRLAEYLVNKNEAIHGYGIKCYSTNYPDIRFTIIESYGSSKNRPFIVFRKNMEIHVFLAKEKAKKYPFLIFTDSPKDFYRVHAKDGGSLPLNILIQLADDAFQSRCDTLNLSTQPAACKKNIKNMVQNTDPDNNYDRELSETDFGISPYIVGNPVEVEDMFFGRQDVIQSIQRQLSTEHKANVILLEGNRRTGKTSILKQLEKENVLPDWVVVNCSFQAGEGTSGGLPTNEVFRLMAREIGLKVFKSGVQPWLPDLPAPDTAKRLEPQFIKALRQAFSTDYPMETFEMYVQAVIEAIKPRRLLLMLDEFDKLQEGIDAGVTSPSVPENIRYLLHTYDFTSILSGSRRIKRLRDEYWSVLFGLGHRIGISALPKEDAQELVTRPVEGRLFYVPEARDRVVELCAGHPFLIQSLCTRIFEYAARDSQRNITLDVVEKSAQEMIADNEHFRTLWGYAGTETRRFLLSLCARVQSDPDPLSVSFLQEKLGQEGIRMEHDALGSDIDFLMELELLVRDATSRTAIYSIGMPLMTLWIMKHIDHTEQRNRAIKEIKETS